MRTSKWQTHSQAHTHTHTHTHTQAGRQAGRYTDRQAGRHITGRKTQSGTHTHTHTHTHDRQTDRQTDRQQYRSIPRRYHSRTRMYLYEYSTRIPAPATLRHYSYSVPRRTVPCSTYMEPYGRNRALRTMVPGFANLAVPGFANLIVPGFAISTGVPGFAICPIVPGFAICRAAGDRVLQFSLNKTLCLAELVP